MHTFELTKKGVLIQIYGTYKKYLTQIGTPTFQVNNIKQSGFKLEVTKLQHREMMRNHWCLRSSSISKIFSQFFTTSLTYSSISRRLITQ